MSILNGLLLVIAVAAAMEGVAYAAHRCIMGRFLHASHHRPRHGMLFSFGFLWAPKPSDLKVEVARHGKAVGRASRG